MKRDAVWLFIMSLAIGVGGLAHLVHGMPGVVSIMLPLAIYALLISR